MSASTPPSPLTRRAPVGPRRPHLTGKRMRALVTVADRIRPWCRDRAGQGLFRLQTAEARALRAALEYLDQLAAWHKDRLQQPEGPPP